MTAPAAFFVLVLLLALAVLVAAGPAGWVTAPLVVPFGGYVGLTLIRRK